VLLTFDQFQRPRLLATIVPYNIPPELNYFRTKIGHGRWKANVLAHLRGNTYMGHGCRPPPFLAPPSFSPPLPSSLLKNTLVGCGFPPKKIQSETQEKAIFILFSNPNVIFLHHPRAIGCTCHCFVRILASHVSSRLTCHDSFPPFFLKSKISAKSPFTSFHNNFRRISVLGGFGQKAGAGVRVHQISHI